MGNQRLMEFETDLVFIEAVVWTSFNILNFIFLHLLGVLLVVSLMQSKNLTLTLSACLNKEANKTNSRTQRFGLIRSDWNKNSFGLSVPGGCSISRGCFLVN